MTRSRRLGTVAVLLGLSIAAAAQSFGPIAARPLYDGVPTIDPYLWLDPPKGLKGGAQAAQETDPVDSAQLLLVTPESPPQAQFFSDFAAIDLPAAAKSVTISIQPIEPPQAAPTDGVVAGNVYDIEVTDDAGHRLAVAPGNLITIVLRGPANLASATIERFENGAWVAADTQPVGIPNLFTTVVGAFGEYALVAPQGWKPAGAKGPVPTPRATPEPSRTVGATVPTATVAPSATTPDTAGQGASAVVGTSPSPAVDSPEPGSTPNDNGPPWPQIVGIAVALLAAAGAGLILLRPVKPPTG